MRARCCAVLRGAECAARRAQRAAPSGLTPTSRPLFSQLTTAEREKLFKLCNKHPTVREIVTGVKTEDGVAADKVHEGPVVQIVTTMCHVFNKKNVQL